MPPDARSEVQEPDAAMSVTALMNNARAHTATPGEPMPHMSSRTREQLADTYRRMAEDGLYRPAAPNDGLGNLTVDEGDLDIDQEIADYTQRWGASEDRGDFTVGCCNFSTRPATVFAIEAARNMCSGSSGNLTALRLLRMAVADLEQVLSK